mmetsp:Transcript_25527/g.40119  ORF Transcript_25527/g.40119 Transcript_25527/m.40119 type:complete len:236 (+) Transcript_25527:977-1684(+)
MGAGQAPPVLVEERVAHAGPLQVVAQGQQLARAGVDLGVGGDRVGQLPVEVVVAEAAHLQRGARGRAPSGRRRRAGAAVHLQAEPEGEVGLDEGEGAPGVEQQRGVGRAGAEGAAQVVVVADAPLSQLEQHLGQAGGRGELAQPEGHGSAAADLLLQPGRLHVAVAVGRAPAGQPDTVDHAIAIEEVIAPVLGDVLGVRPHAQVDASYVVRDCAAHFSALESKLLLDGGEVSLKA